MSEAQIHPEDLLDRAQRGSLAGDELSLFAAHLARCSACRFEFSLAPALYVHARLAPDDAALINRAVAKTGLARRYERRNPVARRYPRRR